MIIKEICTLIFTFIVALGTLTADNSIVPIAPVQNSGSDAQAQAFNAFAPTINNYINNNTTGGKFFFASDMSGVASVIADPASLQLQSASEVRAYYLSAPAPTAADSFGFNANHNTTLTPGQAALIFNTNSAPGAPNTPTASGDFVSLGVLSPNSFLDFFLMATTGDGSTVTWWNDPNQNPDGFPHLSMVQFLNTPYYLLAWEDAAFTGDPTSLYRSLYAVLSINPAVATPEPSTYALLGSLLGVCLFLRLRLKKKTQG